MHRVLKAGIASLAIPAAMALTMSSSFAATSSPTPFGAATFNSSGVQLVSSPSVAPGYAGIDIPLPAGITTLSQITSLDADYQMTTGDCNVGSPRYSISLANGANIFAYFGNAPSYSCGNARQYQSNLLQPYVDDSQLPGGTFYDTYAHALQLAGDQQVTDLAVVLDGGYASPQTAEIFSLSVNGTSINFAAPTSKEQCKNGGWKTFVNPGTFKNQGDCVSFFATHGKNGPNG